MGSLELRRMFRTSYFDNIRQHLITSITFHDYYITLKYSLIIIIPSSKGTKTVRLSPEMCAAVRGSGHGPGARVIVAAAQWQGEQDVVWRWAAEGEEDAEGTERKAGTKLAECESEKKTTTDAKVGGGLWDETMFCCPPDVRRR